MLSKLKTCDLLYRNIARNRMFSFSSSLLNRDDDKGPKTFKNSTGIRKLLGEESGEESSHKLLQDLMKNIKSAKDVQIQITKKQLENLDNANRKKGEEFWFRKTGDKRKPKLQIKDVQVKKPDHKEELLVNSDKKEVDTLVKNPLEIDKLKEDIKDQSDNRSVSKLMSALIDDIDDQADDTEDKLKSLMDAMNLNGKFVQDSPQDDDIKAGSMLRNNKKFNRKRVSLTFGDSANLFQGVSFKTIESETQFMSLSEQEWQVSLNALLPEHIPQNMFEEKLLTIDKQWNFPIDNEQDIGIEEETSFEEHVFLDHYLDEFPEEGAIRKFMELVITGLQQNPHLHVAQKEERIMWFKDYFEKFQPTDFVL